MNFLLQLTNFNCSVLQVQLFSYPSFLFSSFIFTGYPNSVSNHGERQSNQPKANELSLNAVIGPLSPWFCSAWYSAAHFFWFRLFPITVAVI